MLSPISAIELMSFVAAILALIAITAAFRMPSLANRSRVGNMFAALPALVMCGLFYSLAIHMYNVLGGWPGSIGERGFPSALATHGHIAFNYFTLLFLLSIFVWPIFFLLCFFIRRWRFCVYYLAVYAASFLVCFGSMLLAPPQFLNWWWD